MKGTIKVKLKTPDGNKLVISAPIKNKDEFEKEIERFKKLGCVDWVEKK